MGRLDRATLLKRRYMATVRFYADSGMACINAPRVGQGNSVRATPHDELSNQRSAARRNRRNLTLLVRSNRPTHFVTLTFAMPTEALDANKAWNQMTAKRRKILKGFYVRVAEYSKEKSLHFHILCSASISEYLKANWSHGFVDIQRVPFEDLDRICGYMAKDFDNPNRPIRRRFVASKGSKPRCKEMHFESIDEALEGVAALSPLSLVALDIDMYQTSFGSFGDVRWDPGIDGL
jgi:hypothetical protein